MEKQYLVIQDTRQDSLEGAIALTNKIGLAHYLFQLEDDASGDYIAIYKMPYLLAKASCNQLAGFKMPGF